MNYIDEIEKMGACKDALDWLREKNYPTLQEAWDHCERGDWMHWLLAEMPGADTEANRRNHALLACAHARTCLPEWEKRYPDNPRPRLAIDAGERCAKNPTEENRNAAWGAARSAENAAWSAESAAWSAESAAARSAESAAARSAESAAWSAESAAARSAESAARKQQAVTIREFFPACPKLGGE